MATLPNVPGVMTVDHRFTLSGDTNANTKLHFTYTGGPPSTAQLNSLAAAIEGFFATNIQPILGNDRALNEIWVQDLSDMTKPLGLWTGTLTGSSTPGYPASICAVAKYTIARRYRGGHPRGYWPLGRGADAANLGNWTTTGANAMATALNNYITAIKGSTAGGVTITNQCSVGYYQGSTAYTTASGKTKYRANLLATPHVDVVTNVSVNTKMGSQRRRLRHA